MRKLVLHWKAAAAEARPGRRAVAALAGMIVAAAGVLAALAAAPAAPDALNAPAAQPPVVEPTVVLKDDTCRDQDDMCIWVHPTDASLSTVIAADKAAARLIVYDLAGRTLESFRMPMPGNIDLRYGFPLAGGKVDIVACNQRGPEPMLRVYAVDPATRRLRRVDNERIATVHNYGGTMYRSARTGKFYFVTTAHECQQIELLDDGTGKVAGRSVRQWKTAAYTEGAVGDDEAGLIYYGVESLGVYQVGGEPADPTPGKLVAPAGANGLTPDIEGVAIYHRPGGEGYLLVSSQGNSQFKVYRRGTCQYVGTFALAGVSGTDGLDVANLALGKAFPSGLFACHADRRGQCPVVLTPWQDVARALAPPLAIDTSWDPRKAAAADRPR